MSIIQEGALLWTSSVDFTARSRLMHYLDWLTCGRGLRFSAATPEGYARLWEWSTTKFEAFWMSVWGYLDPCAPIPFTQMLGDRTTPGAQRLVGVKLSYVDQVTHYMEEDGSPDRTAVRYASKTKLLIDLSWRELRQYVALLTDTLRKMGVVPGDHVAAYLSNTPDAMVASLAVASVGAI